MAALLLVGTAAAGIAKANQFEGFVNANSCGAIQPVAVNGPSRIDARFAATNAGGFLYAQILSSDGVVLSSMTHVEDSRVERTQLQRFVAQKR